MVLKFPVDLPILLCSLKASRQVSDFFDDLMEGFAEIWRLGVEHR
jgi:hypothetical protein